MNRIMADFFASLQVRGLYPFEPGVTCLWDPAARLHYLLKDDQSAFKVARKYENLPRMEWINLRARAMREEERLAEASGF